MEPKEMEFSIFRRINVLVIKNNKTKQLSDTCLEINTLDFTPNLNQEKDNLGKKIQDCLGIIGIITLENDSYIIGITNAKLVCNISKKEIYKVLDTCFIKFTDDTDLEEENENQNGENKNDENNNNLKINDVMKSKDEELISQLKEMFKNGFYFSNKYDLANSLSSQHQIMLYFQKGKLLSDYDYIAEGNKNFLANWKLTDKVMSLNEKNNIKYFFSNCIYGNIEHFDYEKQKIQIILISRRYLWNFGLYNYRRGLSKYGGNSNQIETELIMIYDNSEIFSNIHLSSYLPIYFKEKKNKEINDANKAFIKYFKTLIDEYNVLFLFALKKDEQEKYVNKFRNMLTKNKNSLDDRWKYFCINTKEKSFKDFLNEMKKKKDLVEFIGFNHLKNILFDKDMAQIGIFSLLSIDDKLLNQNQFYLVYEAIYHILSHLNKTNKIPLFLEENIGINDNLFEENNEEKEKENKINKTENEDFATFLEKLKNMFKNRMNELTKQYYLNYDDELCKKYQRIYEILFGKNMKYSPLKDNLKYLKEEFSDLNTLKIFVGSWNTGCTDISKNKNLILDSWLLPKDTNIIPDIYFIGFQEVMELNTTNLIMLSEEKIQQILEEWDAKINLSIQKIGKYKKLVEMNLVGINFYCYVLENKFDKITNLSKKKVKTGLGGATGNKGSCCINFEYENTSFSVACSHLAAGANKNKQRLKELNYVLDLKLDSFYNPEKLENVIREFDMNDDDKSYEEVMPSSEEDAKLFNSQNLLMSSSPNSNPNANNSEANNDFASFKDSDIWIMFGDLNFRVDMEYEEFSEFIKKGNSWNKLIDYDQFTKFKLASLNFMEWIEEDEIKFPPTYKYITNSNEYDYTPKEKNNFDKKKKEKSQNEQQKSGKKRNPSWCDRVFYKKNAYVTKNGKKIINGIEYNNVMNENFMTSDHRPIYQIFDVIVFKEDDDKKNIIEKEILSNEKLGISSKYMKKKNYDY